MSSEEEKRSSPKGRKKRRPSKGKNYTHGPISWCRVIDDTGKKLGERRAYIIKRTSNRQECGVRIPSVSGGTCKGGLTEVLLILSLMQEDRGKANQ